MDLRRLSSAFSVQDAVSIPSHVFHCGLCDIFYSPFFFIMFRKCKMGYNYEKLYCFKVMSPEYYRIFNLFFNRNRVPILLFYISAS